MTTAAAMVGAAGAAVVTAVQIQIIRWPRRRSAHRTVIIPIVRSRLAIGMPQKMHRPNSVKRHRMRATTVPASWIRRTHRYPSIKSYFCRFPIRDSCRHQAFCHHNRRIYFFPAIKLYSRRIKVYSNRLWIRHCSCIRRIFWPTITVDSCQITIAKMLPKNCPNTIWMLCWNRIERPATSRQQPMATITNSTRIPRELLPAWPIWRRNRWLWKERRRIHRMNAIQLNGWRRFRRRHQHHQLGRQPFRRHQRQRFR